MAKPAYRKLISNNFQFSVNCLDCELLPSNQPSYMIDGMLH